MRTFAASPQHLRRFANGVSFALLMPRENRSDGVPVSTLFEALNRGVTVERAQSRMDALAKQAAALPPKKTLAQPVAIAAAVVVEPVIAVAAAAAPAAPVQKRAVAAASVPAVPAKILAAPRVASQDKTFDRFSSPAKAFLGALPWLGQFQAAAVQVPAALIRLESSASHSTVATRFFAAMPWAGGQPEHISIQPGQPAADRPDQVFGFLPGMDMLSSSTVQFFKNIPWQHGQRATA
jgi:hypothetical protein